MDKTSIEYFIPLTINVIRYFILAGVPFIIFYILFPEKFLKNKIQSRLAKQRDFIREIIHSMQTTLIIAGVILLISYTPLSRYSMIYEDLLIYPLVWVPVSVLCALIIHDTYFYWIHRAIHHPKLFAAIHLMHHKSNNPSPWASYSFHFFEGCLEVLIAPIIIFLIPMHPISLILFAFFAFSMNVYGHLGYEIVPKWFRKSMLFEIINTSTHHNIHHEKFKGNYGLYFRFWDRFMKTEHINYVKEFDKIQKRRFQTL